MPSSHLQRSLWFCALACCLAACCLAAMLVGAVGISLPDALASVAGAGGNQTTRTIVLEVRLPRVLLAVLVGGGIGAAGASVQGLFRNPLADPALIGVSSGAALFAAIYMVSGVAAFLPQVGLAASAFAGGCFATWIVLAVGGRTGGVATMLLAGIAINAVTLAGVGFLSFIATDAELRSVTFWALGSLNGASWPSVATAAVIPVAVVLLVRESANLNALTLGEAEASYLGVNVKAVRYRVVLLSAFCVGVGVALTGVIAFIGLIVPHLVRLTMGSSHQLVIPASALGGALMLLVADTLARWLAAPVEVPVGILTALLGGPFFLYLLVREQRRVVAL